MRGQLPSTAALQCFVTAVETENVTRAAELLCLTQSAVSRQIKHLENHLGQALFERVRQRLKLTDAGQRFYQQVAPLVQLLAQATDEMRQYRAERHIVLGIEPALAGHWLLPKLSEFTEANPTTSIHLMTDIHKLYQRQGACDLAILFGRGHWPGMQVERLMGDELVAVAAPSLVQRLGAIDQPSDLRRYPLLHHTSPESSTGYWWQQVGLDPQQIGRLPGQRLETFPLLLQAAMQGMGAAVLPSYFVAAQLAAGQLIALGSPMPCEGSYFLVADADCVAVEPFAAFRHWLLALARNT